jgi:thimet oligopeptidase
VTLHLKTSFLALTFAIAACSEPATESASTEVPDVPAAEEPQAVSLLMEGPDATLDLESFKEQCASDLTQVTEMYEAIKAYDGPLTIESVLVPYNEFAMKLSAAYTWPQVVNSTHPLEEHRNAAQACMESLITIYTEVGMSKELYAQFTGLDLSSADEVTKFMVEENVRGFESSGVNRDEATREKLRKLSEEAFAQSKTFDKNIREDVRYVEVASAEALDGLPADYIENHAPDEDGVIRISTNSPDSSPIFKYAHSDKLRYDMRMASGNRGYPVNEPVLRDLLRKRQEYAQTLDYPTHAHAVMEDRMIGTPERAQKFIDDINALVKDAAYREKAQYLERYKLIDPEAEQVMPWQRSYIHEILRGERYDLDSKEVREYFQFDLVQEGIFQLTQDLFGVTIRPWETSVWHESVEAFEVVESGEVIGRFYLDLHPRDGKYKHAAHFPLRSGVKGYQIPMGALITNFPGGDGTAGLMEHYQVETFLHEFGHLLHNMFSGTQEWVDVAGTSMERDFVEAPSQMLEEWVWDYETLTAFAKNQAGEVLPKTLFDKMKAAKNFGRAGGTAGQTYLAAMSLEFHTADPETIDFDASSKEIYERYSVYASVPGTHGWANFGHLAGYSSNYYTYQWSNAIAADMFTRFKAEGIRNTETARDYREKVLAAGGSKPADAFIEDFLGRPFSPEAYADKLSAMVPEEEPVAE